MRYLAIGALALLAGCSGNYPHTTLPSFWPGKHMVAGEYVNQDCVVNGPMEYGMDAQKRALRCTALAMREWFK